MDSRNVELTYSENDHGNFSDFDTLYRKLFNTTWYVKDKTFNLKELGWSMGYNNRKTALGVCKPRTKKIEISRPLLVNNMDKIADFEDTIRHEFAHAIDYILRGKSNHDMHWQFIAIELGANGNRCHEGFLEKPKGKYDLVCPNEECDYTRNFYRKPKLNRACYKCCNKYNYGKFDERFRLVLKERQVF